MARKRLTKTPESAPPVDASPTKSLFLEALTSDLTLADAVSDLVDNSADAALRLKGKTNYQGLEVRITFGKGEFEISDNCGGIDLETAAHVLFRLGRPSNYRETPGQIGRFGIGMKRDVFMMGNRISVESWTPTSHFRVDINLETWKSAPEWDFTFSIYEKDIQVPADRLGATIHVADLKPTIKQEFALPNFEQQLIETLQKEQKIALHRELAIFVNKTRLISEPYRLKHLPNHIEPAYFVRSYNGTSDAKLNVDIVAGIEDSKPKDAGWYVACNGRFILVADKTSKTGWGEENEEGEILVPKMHQQYARFRGYVFFECDDAKKLPWNSTKTGLNTDSHVYREIRQLMVSSTRPVVTFLNKVDAEKELDERPLQKAIETAESKSVIVLTGELPKNKNFRFSGLAGKSDPDQPIRISYVKRLGDVQKVRRKLQVEKNREVGSRTFDYFVDHEVRKKS
jgi:hypothetical protein